MAVQITMSRTTVQPGLLFITAGGIESLLKQGLYPEKGLKWC